MEQYPLRFSDFYVESLKIYGFYIKQTGFHNNENFKKAESQIRKIDYTKPPKGVSIYGRVHCLNTYFLSMLWYVVLLLPPSDDFIRDAYKRIDKFIWFPSKKNHISRNKSHLNRTDGGINYPNIFFRVASIRLMTVIKRWRGLQPQAWFIFFDVFHERLRNVNVRRLAGQRVPQFYIYLKKFEISFQMRKINRECFSLMGKIYKISTCSGKQLYNDIVKKKFQRERDSILQFWYYQHNFDMEYLRNSWNWSVVRYEDGATRSLHFSLRHNIILTHWQEHFFRDVPFYCTYCFLVERITINETLSHVLFYCPRIFGFYTYLQRYLNRIEGSNNYYSMQEILFGKRLNEKRLTNLFNLVIHTGQRAIIEHKKQCDSNITTPTVVEIFERLLLNNLYQVKHIFSDEGFVSRFGGENGIAYLTNTKRVKLCFQ
jgi:hypothetical protein